jgi:hypothetical protein
VDGSGLAGVLGVETSRPRGQMGGQVHDRLVGHGQAPHHSVMIMLPVGGCGWSMTVSVSRSTYAER